jgi:MoxR-like ATPase
LQDRTRIKHLVRNLPDDNSPKDALKRTLNAIEHTLIPQLDRVLQVLPLSAERGGATLVSERVSILANEARGEPVSDDPLELPTADLDPFVSKIVDDVSLPEKMVQRCLVHLLAGRHLILVGPPGTGKSTIAGKLCRALGYDAELATANPDWTTQDVVGGLAPHAHTDATGEVRVGYGVRDGCVAAAIKRNWATAAGRWERTSSEAGKGVWLIIDEINRAPMDHAFGDLFSALVSGVLHVPRVSQAGDIGTTLAIPIPQDFRLIGTANTADRHLLFQMSEALKRRFAFVEVPAYFSSDRQVPVDHIPRIVRQLSERPQLRALRIPDLSERLTLLLSLVNPVLGRIRALHDLGIAQILDALCTTLVESRFRPEVPLELVLSDVLGDQAMQALDTLPADALRLVAALLNGSAHCFLAELLHRWLALGDEIPTPARAHMFALRGYFSTHSDPLWQSFAAALDDALYRRASWSTVAAALPNAPGLLAALDVAAPLAERLIRLADARE